ncbi:arginine N-methyltransferase SFM1 [Lecanosticta acicola]|uniref:Arginine N-methyltransferase SFM1 n=1 Tax=Lecanosticta acicola TaxID=111012 RepID=A0AAI8YZW9_9PEZI|nr:arginine N-methyltransferase SFM1 [Lecanosticta acicola]
METSSRTTYWADLHPLPPVRPRRSRPVFHSQLNVPRRFTTNPLHGRSYSTISIPLPDEDSGANASTTAANTFQSHTQEEDHTQLACDEGAAPQKYGVGVAGARLLHITELVEEILLHLPLCDILTSQATCRAFRNTVRGSIRLKRRLFLAQDPNSTAVVLNPLLSQLCASSHYSSILEVLNLSDRPASWPSSGMTSNTIFSHAGRHFEPAPFYPYSANPLPLANTETDSACLHWQLKELGQVGTGNEQHFSAMPYESSAWHMLLCQTPNPIDVHITVRRDPEVSSHLGACWSEQVSLQNGTVRELIQKLVEKLDLERGSCLGPGVPLRVVGTAPAKRRK